MQKGLQVGWGWSCAATRPPAAGPAARLPAGAAGSPPRLSLPSLASPPLRRTLARFVGKVMLVLEALQPAMMQQAAEAAEAAAAEAVAAAAAGGTPPPLEPLGSESLAKAWSAALRDSPADSPASQRRRRASGQLPSREASLAPPDTPHQPRDARISAWAEAAADVKEALQAAAALVADCAAMGRLQVGAAAGLALGLHTAAAAAAVPNSPPSF